MKMISKVCLNGSCYYLWKSITLLHIGPSELGARSETRDEMSPLLYDICDWFPNWIHI